MCGRYTLYQTGELRQRFGLDEAEIEEIEDDLKARYNIAPSQILPAIIEKDDKRHIELMQWGYMPHWAKDQKSVFKYKTFNTRSEGVFDKPTWKSAILHRRCLVPSNGFYEWKATPTGKQPYFIRPKDQELFAFAGIYGEWRDSQGASWNTYSILTTRPNKEMEAIHNRMPVLLHPTDEDRWLDPTSDKPSSIQDMMRPYDDGMLEYYEVSREVNTSRVDGETLIGPIGSK